ncbi:MAG: hypothetical protein OEW35_03585 [Gammaproteobacteria bacterium]|nr:hypothetical protein [Gammaproteobacteria bacterium]MDH4254177.1 hypothetical protein [Gammaproteobacteria bacterium]MDH5309971.1 hypothetical protein [Gammaproteobacteria bacterium]
MPRIVSFKHSLELLAALIAGAAVLGVLQTFIFGRHYVIPTLILALAVLLGNLARFGYRGQAWAKHTLFWIFFVLTSHLFFALFFAARPRELLGSAFMPVYGFLFLAFAVLAIQYGRHNRLFRA